MLHKGSKGGAALFMEENILDTPDALSVPYTRRVTNNCKNTIKQFWQEEKQVLAGNRGYLEQQQPF